MDPDFEKFLLILMAGFAVSTLAVAGYDYLSEKDPLQRIIPEQHTSEPADPSEKP